MTQAEQLKFIEFLGEQAKGYSNPSEAKASMREYYERVLAGESGQVDSRFRAYLEGKLSQLERTPVEYDDLGRFASKTGMMVEFMAAIGKSSGRRVEAYEGWTDADSGPMPSGVAGGVTEVSPRSRLVSPSQRLIFTGSSKGTIVSEMPLERQAPVATAIPVSNKPNVNWFGIKKTTPLQKALLATGEVPAEYIFGGKGVSLSDYEKNVGGFEQRRTAFEKKIGEFNIRREFYEVAPSEMGYALLAPEAERLKGEQVVLEQQASALNRMGTGLTFAALAPKLTGVIPETQTRFLVSPEDRGRARQAVEAERKSTSLETGISSGKDWLHSLPVFKEYYGVVEKREKMALEEKNPLQRAIGLGAVTVVSAPLGLFETGIVGFEALKFYSQKPTVKAMEERKEVATKVFEAPKKVGEYVTKHPLEAGFITAGILVSGIGLSKLSGLAGSGIGRAYTAFKPVNVIQKTNILVTVVKDAGTGSRLVTGKMRSTGFADLPFGKSAKIEAGGAFKSLVKPQVGTIYAPALPSASGKLSLVKTPVEQVGLRSLRESFLPSEAPLTTRQPFLQNVRATSAASGAVKTSVLKGDKVVAQSVSKFRGVSAQMESINRPTVTSIVDRSPISEVRAFRAETVLGGKFTKSVGTIQLRSGEPFISRGVTKSVAERVGVDELLFGKSEVRGVKGIFKPRANIIEQITVEQAVGKRQMPIPKSVSFSQLAEQPKSSKPFSFNRPSEPLKTEFVSPKLEKPTIRAVYEKPSKTGMVELTREEKATLQKQMTGELEVQRAAIGGEATRLIVFEFEKAGSRVGWLAGGLGGVRLVSRASTTTLRPQYQVQVTPLITKTGTQQNVFPELKTIPMTKSDVRILTLPRIRALEKTGQIEKITTIQIVRDTTEPVTPITHVPPVVPLDRWTFGVPLGLPQLGGGRQHRKRGFNFGLPSSIYKPSVIASEFKIRARVLKGVRLTGLEIRPIPK